MNLQELDSFNLADAVKFNDKLNPRIWDGEKMRPEVRAKLLEIATDFKESLGLNDLDVEDITVSGSNAGFTYTPHSDIDLHLVVRMPDHCDDVYQELFNAKKYQYNDEHDIKIGGYDVELYVQPADQEHVSAGVYSVKNNDWIHIPRKIAATADDAVVKDKYELVKSAIESALKSKDIGKMRRVWDKVKEMRKAGLAKNGELGPENIAFKMLRTQGDLGELKDSIRRARDAELSLAEQNKGKKPFVYGYKTLEDVTATPDGVGPSTRMFLSEKPVPPHEEIIRDFIKFARKKIGLKKLPKFKLHKDPQWSIDNQSFGRYTNDTDTVDLAIGERHIMDILRTLAHELQHRKQDERETMPFDAGKTGSPYENEAHAVAGVIMREYADLHPEYFEDIPVAESASGYIPTKAQAKDPRYAMALTVDIKPGQTGKEANKMALKTDKQGKPALLMKTANMIGESRVSLFNWLKQQFPTWPDYVLKDFLYQQAKGIRDQAELEDFLKRNKQDFGQIKWRLEKLPITLDIFTPKTQRMIQSREGGSSNPFSVPRDAERHAQQLKMIRQQGVRTEPIIVAKLNNGYDLIEGWHRTIQHLKAYPQGYVGPAWVGYGATYTSVAEDKDSLAESLLGEFKLFEQDLFEVKMTSKNLAKLAKDIPGVKVGLEFEMIVPNVNSDDGGDMEPDYDEDQRVRDIDDCVEFFDDGDYNGRNELRRLRENMESDFFDWQMEQIDEAWHNNGFEFFQEYLDREDPFDPEDHKEEAYDYVLSNNPTLHPDSEEFNEKMNERLQELNADYYVEQWDEQGRNYDYAREEFEDEQRDEISETDWLGEQGIRYASDVESNYGHVTWPYYRSSNEGETDAKEVALDFMNAMGYKSIAVGDYHGYGGGYQKWNGSEWVKIGSTKPDDCFTVEPDGSLQADDSDDTGLEFVSPPIPLDQIGETMRKVQQWAAGRGVYTGKSNATSMHTNISIPGYDLDKLDYLKAALLLGDEHVLRQFDRIGNTYARPAIEKVKQLVQQKPDKAKELLDKMKSQLNAEASKMIHSGVTDKYTSINTKDNRVEFRSPGGDYLSDIADNPQKMIDTINRMVVTLDAAMDPNKYKEEYQKKLYKVLTGQAGGREAKTGAKQEMKKDDKDLLNIFSRYAAGELPKQALKSFVRQAQLERKVAREKDANVKMWWNVARDGQRMEVVATNEMDAKLTAAKEWGIVASDDNLSSMTAKPLRPYDDTSGGPQVVAQQPTTPRWGIWDFQRGGFVNSRGGVGDGQGRLIGGDTYDATRNAARNNGLLNRLDNGEFEIRQIPAQQSAPIPGSTLDLQRQRAAAAQQNQGNWGIWIQNADRFANQPGEYPVGTTPPLYRFPTREAAEQWIEQQRATRPNMRTDIEVREIERSDRSLGNTTSGNWGVWVPSLDRYASIGNAGPRRFENRAEAEAWVQDYNQRHSGNDLELQVREIEPSGSLPDIFPELPRSQDRPWQDSDYDAALARARVADNAEQAPNWEIRNASTNGVLDQFYAPDQDTAIGTLSDILQDQGLDVDDYVLQAIESNANDNWSADFERRMQGGGNNPEWENPQPAPTFGGTINTANEPTTGSQVGQTYNPSGSGEFTGQWLILNPNNQVIYRFGGIGNSQSDANRHAMNWLTRNPREMVDGVTVVPEMG